MPENRNEAETLFCCPVCGAPLAARGACLCCAAHHSFDVAREGYVHLLPASKMRAKVPGDSAQMVAARRSFLEAGFYRPFAQTLGELLCARLNAPEPIVLDAGCGEGYYTRAAAHALPAARVAAFDISKYAVRAAARLGGAQYAVAGSFAIPVADGRADVLLNIFSPAAAAEFARVLRPGGLLVYAVPAPRHLLGLKRVLYETPYENPVQEVAYAGFACMERVPVRGEIRIEGAQIQNLFYMTPYYWKTPRAGAERLAACGSLTTEIGFDFLIYRRES